MVARPSPRAACYSESSAKPAGGTSQRARRARRGRCRGCRGDGRRWPRCRRRRGRGRWRRGSGIGSRLAGGSRQPPDASLGRGVLEPSGEDVAELLVVASVALKSPATTGEAVDVVQPRSRNATPDSPPTTRRRPPGYGDSGWSGRKEDGTVRGSRRHQCETGWWAKCARRVDVGEREERLQAPRCPTRCRTGFEVVGRGAGRRCRRPAARATACGVISNRGQRVDVRGCGRRRGPRQGSGFARSAC